MTTNFTYKYSSCVIEYIPNDVSITLISYLVDSNNRVYVDPNTLKLDTFDVKIFGSSLPSNGYAGFLSIIAANAISIKYNQTVSGYGTYNGTTITQITSTSNLIPGLYVYGTSIPPNTTLVNVLNSTSIELSNPVTTVGNVTLTLTTLGWVIDYSALTALTTVINFSML